MLVSVYETSIVKRQFFGPSGGVICLVLVSVMLPFLVSNTKQLLKIECIMRNVLINGLSHSII